MFKFYINEYKDMAEYERLKSIQMEEKIHLVTFEDTDDLVIIDKHAPKIKPLYLTAPTTHSIYWIVNGDAPNISYSYDRMNWTEWADITQAVTFGDSDAHRKIYFKGDNATSGFNRMWDAYSFLYCRDGNADVSVGGNIMSLVDYGACTSTTVTPFDFYCLFCECTSIVDASELMLPAKTMVNSCYQNLFKLCSHLTAAPELQATTLADMCYGEMFKGCTSLTTAPELKALTLANGCYSEMFSGCSSLSSITCLATDITTAWSPTSNWVEGVAERGFFYVPSSMKTDWQAKTGYDGKPNFWAFNLIS